MGVWIETKKRISPGSGSNVTPYVGVWIETVMETKSYIDAYVTPYVGVWIETYDQPNGSSSRVSLLMWECGLKPYCVVTRSVRQRHSLCGSVD